MRRLARMGLALCGVALAAPTGVWADPPGAPSTGSSVMSTMGPYAPQPDNAPPAPAPAADPSAPQPHKHRRGLFRPRHLCPDCQRAEVLARDGVSIPAPPTVPAMVMTGGDCNQCPPGTVAMEGQSIIVDTSAAPGYAVTGEPAPGSEPVPIGVVQQGYPGMMMGGPAVAGRGPTRDPMLMPTSMAPEPIRGPGHNRPHVISHLLGISAIGRSSREARDRARRERHASIPYGPQTEKPITELPSSLVYGRGAH